MGWGFKNSISIGVISLLLFSCSSYKQVPCPHSGIRQDRNNWVFRLDNTHKPLHVKRYSSKKNKSENQLTKTCSLVSFMYSDTFALSTEIVKNIPLAIVPEPDKNAFLQEKEDKPEVLKTNLISIRDSTNTQRSPQDTIRKNNWHLPEIITDIRIKGNEFGVAAVFTGIIAFFVPLQLGIFLAILALIFGYAGIRQTKKTGLKKRAAVAGLILGTLMVILAVVLLA